MKILLTILCMVSCALVYGRATEADQGIGFVNFKKCIEKSKQGQHEQNAFEGLKKQMSDALEKTEKELEDIAKKLEDQDYMDGLSPTAEEELKQKFQILSQDYSRYHNQFYQLLAQAHHKMLQTLRDEANIAAEQIRESKKLALILGEDSVFAYIPPIDCTEAVIEQMDRQFNPEN